MSELKVIKAYMPTFDDDHNDILLVSHTKENYVSAKQIECYLKSEADKVISYHKYKRCKKMAMLCELEIDQWIEYSDRWQRRKKWLNLWLELAEKFKSMIDYEN